MALFAFIFWFKIPLNRFQPILGETRRNCSQHSISIRRWSTYIYILGSNIPSIWSSLHNIHAPTTSPFIKWSIRRYSTSSDERNDYLGNYLCNPYSWVINHDSQPMVNESLDLWVIYFIIHLQPTRWRFLMISRHKYVE